MTTRSVLGLLYTANALIDQGFDVNAIMQKHGLPIESIDATARIERARELEILNDFFSLTSDPLIGLTIGQQMGLAGYGPISMLIISCKTTYDACLMGIKYQALTYLFGDMSLELGKPLSALVIEPMPVPQTIADFILLRDLSGTLRFINDIHKMNDLPFQLTEVHLTLAPPADKRRFEEVFKCPILFGQEQNKLVIETHYLNVAFPQANQNAVEMYREQCEKMLLESSSQEESVSRSLYRYLSMFNYEIPSVIEAASTFGVSERTLRRQLKAEETNYQRILDEVRFEKAKHWLLYSQTPIEDISHKLGYQEPAAFNHAFKRWSDMTPSQYRKTRPES